MRSFHNNVSIRSSCLPFVPQPGSKPSTTLGLAQMSFGVANSYCAVPSDHPARLLTPALGTFYDLGLQHGKVACASGHVVATHLRAVSMVSEACAAARASRRPRGARNPVRGMRLQGHQGVYESTCHRSPSTTSRVALGIRNGCCCCQRSNVAMTIMNAKKKCFATLDHGTGGLQ